MKHANHTFKRILSALLTLLLAASLATFTLPAFAEGGECGKNATWSLEGGVLTISGTGAMSDYSFRNYNKTTTAPWFENRYSIKKVIINEGISTIGSAAFGYLAIMNEAVIPESCTVIGSYAFSDCESLEKISIGNEVTLIGDYAFSDCKSLTSVTLSKELVKLYNNAFYNCTGLRSVYFGKELKIIGNDAFNNCTGLKVINIPESVTEIGSYAFNNCNALSKVEIPQGVSNIYKHTFSECENLRTVYIPTSVKTISSYAFYKSNNVQSIYYAGNEEQWKEVVIENWANDVLFSNNLTVTCNTKAISRYLDVLSTDIRSYLYGSEISSYNINNSTGIVAEDLMGYGFTVVWDSDARTLSISHPSDDYTQAAKKDFGAKTGVNIGEKLAETQPTDIITYINGTETTAFNIGGQTVIYIDSLAPFGNVKWDAVTRTISVE